MNNWMSKREFLKAGLAVGAGLSLTSAAADAAAPAAGAARGPRGLNANVKRRKVKTTALFKSPPGYPNAAALDPDGQGIWIGEQKLTGQSAASYGIPSATDLNENAWLLDWNGKLLKTVRSNSRNTSGMAVGGGYVWMMANAAPNGVFQIDMDSHQVSHRQIPLGGGGCHGGQWRNGKLWIASTRLRCLMQVNPDTWQPEYLLPVNTWDRMHDMTFDDTGATWVITGTSYGSDYKDDRPGIAKYNTETGQLLEYAEFAAGDSDPHGLVFYNGAFYSCDAGIHPGWPTGVSKTAGYIFRIDVI